MTNVTTQLGKLTLKNPVLVASGTFGYGDEYAAFVPVEALGGVITKTVTRLPRGGNLTPRIYETPSGMLNSIGLANVGIERFIAEKLPFFSGKNTACIVSIAAESPVEFAELTGMLDAEQRVDAIELNISCPNVHYGETVGGAVMQFAQDARALEEVVKAARAVTSKTIITKLSPAVTDIVSMALAAEAAGSDALDVANTFRGMAIDIHTRKPRLAKGIGGLSGPAIKPLALRAVYEVARKIDIPIIGTGGIMTAADALEFLIAGATAVSIGTATFIEPRAAINVREGIDNYLGEKGIGNITDIVGTVNL